MFEHIQVFQYMATFLVTATAEPPSLGGLLNKGSLGNLTCTVFIKRIMITLYCYCGLIHWYINTSFSIIT